ncbi:MAG TPA: hypothetical protein PLM07_05775 [Candidatus Rifleibacterium sp.]|nr:hypothetical protein [Candidatus Rifleibacterium sp.]
MGFQNVLIGMAWESGQYRVAFQKTVPAVNSQAITFQEVEINSGYLDKLSVLSRKQVERLLTKPEDLACLKDAAEKCSFFLLHQTEL